MMRSKDFSFSFAENIGEFIILGRNIRKIRSFCKFCKISLNVQRARQSSKLPEPGSFNVHKNTAASMIAILGHPELDMEVSDTDMETAESDNCRGMSRKDRDTNGMLAMM